ncbi:hypothetical protein K2X30_05345 [bacterium]|nr:hypothetical protein [bacterium]
MAAFTALTNNEGEEGVPFYFWVGGLLLWDLWKSNLLPKKIVPARWAVLALFVFDVGFFQVRVNHWRQAERCVVHSSRFELLKKQKQLAPECVWKVLIPSFTRSDGLEMAPENDLRHPYENHRQFLGLSKHTPARVKIQEQF